MLSLSKQSVRGFTLVEVLLACTVLAIGLTLAAMQFSKHLALTRRMEESVLAARVAEIHMEEVRWASQ